MSSSIKVRHSNVDQAGNYISVDEWADLRESAERRVALEVFSDGSIVETFWCGINKFENFHSMRIDGAGSCSEALRSENEKLAREAHEILAWPLRSREEALNQYNADSGVEALQDGAL